MIAIYRRELSGFFDTLTGYGVIAAFVVVMMLLSLLLDPLEGGGDWFKRGELSMRTFFGIYPWVAAVVIPAVSMRLWAEDRRQATFEMLMTLPIPTWRIVLGKYLAAVTFLVLMLAATAAFPFLLTRWGQPDWGPVVGGYVACFVLGSAFVAVGMFVSGLTNNQALAFFLALLLCLGIVGVGELRGLLGDMARSNPPAALTHLLSIPAIGLGFLAAAAARDKMVGVVAAILGFVVNAGVYVVAPEPKLESGVIQTATPAAEAMIEAISQISVMDHFTQIERGVVSSNALVFFASWIVLFVALNILSLGSRRYI